MHDNEITNRIEKTLTALEDETASDYDADYKPLYYFLFAGIADLTDELIGLLKIPNSDEIIVVLSKIISHLIHLQETAEEMYVSQGTEDNEWDKE